MYYIIKKQPPLECFQGFEATKYFLPKNSENVIFEVLVGEKRVKKWFKRDEIILLTKNQELYSKTIAEFRNIASQKVAKINEIQKQLDSSIKEYISTLNNALNNFNYDDESIIQLQ